MSKRKQLLFKLMTEYELEKYDAIDLGFLNLYFIKNQKPSIQHNMVQTLTTRCNIAVVVGGEKNE